MGTSLGHRLVMLLAAVGLLFGAFIASAAPVSASSGETTVAAVGDEAPPCHHKTTDAAKSCLGMAACMAKCFQAVPIPAPASGVVATLSDAIILPSDAQRVGLGVPPPLRPPRS
jgi:hypothetical protein